MAMSSNGDGLDQLEEGNAAGGHTGEVEAIPYPAVSPSMTSRRFPTPWHADPMPDREAGILRQSRRRKAERGQNRKE
jgi:hypothetical protein